MDVKLFFPEIDKRGIVSEGKNQFPLALATYPEGEDALKEQRRGGKVLSDKFLSKKREICKKRRIRKRIHIVSIDEKTFPILFFLVIGHRKKAFSSVFRTEKSGAKPLLIVRGVFILYNRENMKKGILFIISGPSGVGKGTLRQKVMERKDLNLVYSVSMTTRQKRPGETEGVEYYFVSEETFEENIKKNNFLEYNRFVGHSYGTPRDKVEKLLSEGKNVLLEIDVNGASTVMKNEQGVVSIFVLPPSFEELERRIRGRMTEKEGDIEGRLEQARREIALKDKYTYSVINDNLDRAAGEIASIIEKAIR